MMTGRRSSDDLMGERACVGAGLPAMAVGQSNTSNLTLRYRGQARSHRGWHFNLGKQSLNVLPFPHVIPFLELV